MSAPVEEIARFIADVQAQPRRRMAMVGVQAAEIAEQIKEFNVPFISRSGDSGLWAALGVDYDAELRKAWLYGPFIDHASWAKVADELWEESRSLVPADTRDIEIGYVSDNEEAKAFGIRHGFEVFSEGRLMAFSKERVADLPDAPDVSFLSETHKPDVEALHNRLFPNTWLSGRQMFARENDLRRVFVATDAEDHPIGYLYAEAKPDHGEATLEFVGVDEAARGRGVAKRVVAGALKWILSFDGIEAVELYVRDENVAARRVYESVGFTVGPPMVGARKELATGDR